MTSLKLRETQAYLRVSLRLACSRYHSAPLGTDRQQRHTQHRPSIMICRLNHALLEIDLEVSCHQNHIRSQRYVMCVLVNPSKPNKTVPGASARALASFTSSIWSTDHNNHLENFDFIQERSWRTLQQDSSPSTVHRLVFNHVIDYRGIEDMYFMYVLELS